MNPWHDIPCGKKVPKEFNVIVEIPQDSMNKYELDKETGILKLSRVLYSSVHYPGNYGFIPQTLWLDDDPLDVLIIGTTSIHPLTLVTARPVGVFKMVDNYQDDHKIIAVPAGDPRYDDIKDIKDMPKHRIREIRHFFRIYKELQDVSVKVFQVKDKVEAEKAVMKSMELYKEKFDKKKK